MKLIPIEYQGQVLDACEKCQGAWFEAGELESAWKDAHGKLKPGRAIIEDYHTSWSMPLQENDSQMICPDCGTDLKRHYLLDNYRVELTRCPSCEGVWVDESQRCAVHYAPKVRAALKEISKPSTVKHFIFQLLTRLPVEFNMKPRNFPWATWLLIGLNLLIFVVVLTDPYLYATGGFIPAELNRGDNLYTLLTYQFQHGDFGHIAGNMFFLYITGGSIEDMIGHYKFLLVYLAGGVAAALAEWLIAPGNLVPIIGASGSISALFGIYMLWFRKAKLTYMIVVFQLKVAPWIFFLIWALIQIGGIFSLTDGIAYMAHLGGFTFGLVIGIAGYKSVLKNNPVLAHINSPYVKTPVLGQWTKIKRR